MSNVSCLLCPRKCGSDRADGRFGFCLAPDDSYVASYLLHKWEEPCISGKQGSGTVFFSGCSLRCVFCQNCEISREIKGKSVNAEQLSIIFKELEDAGAENINLVTPTVYARTVSQALEKKLNIPVVYNCGGYESVETLKMLEGKIDVYLPDFKYSDSMLAEKYSKAPQYAETASAAIKEMFRQTGKYTLDGRGIMTGGVLIRHLILPGELENTFGVIDWIAGNFEKNDIMFSLMSQYTPAEGIPSEFENLKRRITREEYQRAEDYMLTLGIEDGFVQDIESAEGNYVPEFTNC